MVDFEFFTFIRNAIQIFVFHFVADFGASTAPGIKDTYNTFSADVLSLQAASRFQNSSVIQSLPADDFYSLLVTLSHMVDPQLLINWQVNRDRDEEDILKQIIDMRQSSPLEVRMETFSVTFRATGL